MKEILRTLAENGQAPAQQGGSVVMGNLRRTSERIDSNGNVIDPATKQIIKRNEGDGTPIANPRPE